MPCYFSFSFSLVYLRLQPRKSSPCFRTSFEIYLSKPKAKLLRKGITSAGFFSSCYIPLLRSSSLVRGAILSFSFSSLLHPLNCHDILHADNTRFIIIDAYTSGANGKRGGKKGWWWWMGRGSECQYREWSKAKERGKRVWWTNIVNGWPRGWKEGEPRTRLGRKEVFFSFKN